MSKQSKFRKYSVLGVEVDDATSNQAADYIVALAKGPACYVVKPYVEFIDQAAAKPDLTKLLNDAELCLPDGISVVWAAHYLHGGKPGFWRLWSTLFRIVLNPVKIHRPLPEGFRGIDFTTKLLQKAAQQKLSVFLVGSPKKGRIADTAVFLSQKFKGVRVVGHFTGHLNAELEQELIKTLRAVKADLILVGMGFPKQERLMAILEGKLQHGVMVGEGGTFDYREFGGRIKRAPLWIRRLWLEWLWRLFREPARVVRQMAIPRFIYLVYKEGKRRGQPH